MREIDASKGPKHESRSIISGSDERASSDLERLQRRKSRGEPLTTSFGVQDIHLDLTYLDQRRLQQSKHHQAILHGLHNIKSA